MGQLAFVFPGQGAQQPGMGRELHAASPAAKAVMDRAEALLPGLLKSCFEGPMEQLSRTEVLQPALMAVSLACAAAAEEAGIRPDAAAGFSLGEWTACAYAGMLPFEQAFDLVRKRGEWMRQCAEQAPGGMAAVLRLGVDELSEILKEFPGVLAVNFNAPDQTVVAAALPALHAFLDAMKARGVRCVRLNVSGAFHSPLMADASAHLLAALRAERIAPPAIPIISNLGAQPYGADAADTLALQASSPVKWVDSIKTLARMGVTRFLELGPGTVLTGLVRKILPDALVMQAEDPEGIRIAAERLGVGA